MIPLMNDTKWNELRLAMYNLGVLRARWRTKDISGFESQWDGEWYDHFRGDGYTSIERVELQILSPEQDDAVLNILRQIHLPGQRIDCGFRIYGYTQCGNAMSVI